MWVCLNDAFLSIVHKDCARDELLVRARRKGDIEKLFPDARVKVDRLTDYLYRAVVKRDAVRQAMDNEVRRINYGNFKDSVEDRPLHDAYLRVWTAMTALQPGWSLGGLWSKNVLGHSADLAPAPSPRKNRKRKVRTS